MHYKFLIERWVNRRRFIIDNRNWQKFGLRGELIYVYSHYILTAENVVLIVVSKELSTVKSSLIIVLFQRLCDFVKMCIS